MKKYTVLNEFVRITSKWVTIIGENCIDAENTSLEYWRVEKEDSLIILPIQNNHILLPPPLYRHGVGISTWDFPGGRLPTNDTADIISSGYTTLNREINVHEKDVEKISPLCTFPLIINSAFSKQKLYTFVVIISDSWKEPPKKQIDRYSISTSGISGLLERLECLQCRAILLEFLYREGEERSKNG